MIDSKGENTGVTQMTLSKLVFLYSFNILCRLLDELLELKEKKTFERRSKTCVFPYKSLKTQLD